MDITRLNRSKGVKDDEVKQARRSRSRPEVLYICILIVFDRVRADKMIMRRQHLYSGVSCLCGQCIHRRQLDRPHHHLREPCSKSSVWSVSSSILTFYCLFQQITVIVIIAMKSNCHLVLCLHHMMARSYLHDISWHWGALYGIAGYWDYTSDLSDTVPIWVKIWRRKHVSTTCSILAHSSFKIASGR